MTLDRYRLWLWASHALAICGGLFFGYLGVTGATSDARDEDWVGLAWEIGIVALAAFLVIGLLLQLRRKTKTRT
jgi:hypothetical protein